MLKSDNYAGAGPTFLLRVQQNKHGCKSFLRKNQKWSAAMSPGTHAVDLRHDSNSSNKETQSSVHQPNDAEASTSSQSAEEQRRSGEEPISGAFVPLTDDAESGERRPARRRRSVGQRHRRARLLVQQRPPGCLLKETRTRNWAKTHFCGFGGNEAEGGKEGGEFQHESQALEAVGELVRSR